MTHIIERKIHLPCVHEFGIINHVDFQENYDAYTPQKYNCISIDDDLIDDDLAEKLSIMKTYFHSFDRPEIGLDYYGITIIPPESLSLFYEAVVSSNEIKTSDELRKLASKIIEATEENKYMIHYGV